MLPVGTDSDPSLLFREGVTQAFQQTADRYRIVVLHEGIGGVWLPPASIVTAMLNRRSHCTPCFLHEEL